jgi:hypothetical protein
MSKKNKTEKPILNYAPDDITRAMQQATNFGSPLTEFDTLIESAPANLIAINQVTVGNIYVKDGIIQNIINVPVKDALRGNIDIISDSLDVDEKDINKLEFAFNHNIVNEEKGMSNIDLLIDFGINMRLWGGAGIIIDDGGDLTKEFNIDSIQKGDKIEFYNATPFELNMSNVNRYGEKKPGVTDLTSDNPYMFYETNLHKSRVIRVNNRSLPPILRPMMRSWGLSELEQLVRILSQKNRTEEALFSLLKDANTTFYQIPKLMEILQNDNGANALAKLLNDIFRAKDYNHTLISDSEANLQQIQVDFNGISRMMIDTLIPMLAMYSGIPLCKLTGQTSGGMNGLTEAELEMYNSKVESDVRRPLKVAINKLLQISAKTTLGYIPESLYFEYAPLRTLSEEQIQQGKNAEFNRIKSLLDTKLIKPKIAAEMINRSKLLPMQIDIKTISDDFDDLNLTETDKSYVPSTETGNINSINTKMKDILNDGVFNKIKRMINK